MVRVLNALQIGVEKWAAEQVVEPETVLYLDTETNGLEPDQHYILEVGVIDGTGKTLFESFIKPRKLSPGMELLTHYHGISYDMLKDAPLLPEVFEGLLPILQSAKTILVYNKPFDSGMLAGMAQRDGLSLPTLPWGTCVMRQYATYHHGYPGGRWQQLGQACTQLQITALPGMKAHRAVADCQSTRQVVKALASRYRARALATTAMEAEVSRVSEAEA